MDYIIVHYTAGITSISGILFLWTAGARLPAFPRLHLCHRPAAVDVAAAASSTAGGGFPTHTPASPRLATQDK